MRDVVVIGPTKDKAREFARRLEDDVKARVLAARTSALDGVQADHWIILHGVAPTVVDAVRYLAAKNGAPVTFR